MPYTPQEYESQYNNGGRGSRTTSWEEYNRYLQAGGVNGGNTGQDVGNFFLRTGLGGPVGTGEYAYGASQGKPSMGGNDLLGIHFGNGTTINKNMTEGVYNSMTPEEWENFAHMNEQEQNNFIAYRMKDVAKDQAKKAKFDAAELEKKKAADEYDKVYNERIKRQNDIMARVQAFADEMNMPIDQLMQKDEFAKALNANVYQQASSAGNYGGVGGGLSQQNADLQTKRALLGYQMERQARGQQALNQVYGMQQQQIGTTEGIRQFNAGLDQYNQNLDLQMQALRAQSQQQAYQQGLQRSGQTLGMIGGVIGGIYGGAGGASAGYNIGSGLGQSQYQNNNPYKPYQYNYPSTNRNTYGTSGGGLGSYGGNY